jgi:hypothetical protein
MHDMNDVQFFAAVVENQGFSAASRALNLPKSSVSRRIANLEARLGVRLIERSTRSLRLTKAFRFTSGDRFKSKDVKEIVEVRRTVRNCGSATAGNGRRTPRREAKPTLAQRAPLRRPE